VNAIRRLLRANPTPGDHLEDALASKMLDLLNKNGRAKARSSSYIKGGGAVMTAKGRLGQMRRNEDEKAAKEKEREENRIERARKQQTKTEEKEARRKMEEPVLELLRVLGYIECNATTFTFSNIRQFARYNKRHLDRVGGAYPRTRDHLVEAIAACGDGTVWVSFDDGKQDEGRTRKDQPSSSPPEVVVVKEELAHEDNGEKEIVSEGGCIHIT